MRPISLLLLIAMAFLLFSCGGKHKSALTPSPVVPAPTVPVDTDVNSVLSELEAMPTPEGVDAEVFQKLKQELATQLESRGSMKITSAPPSGESNRVDDLFAYDNGDGTATLVWYYRNAGDYDQNGTVGISDITPIAIHYGEDATFANEWVDGDDSGAIGISDITPIAMNYGVQCAGYAIESSPSEVGTYTPEDTIDFSEASGDARLRFEHTLPLTIGHWVRVIPVDSESARGTESTVAPVAATGGGAEVSLGTTTVETSQTMGPDGGTITGPPGTDLEGISVTFPPGALPREVLVELGTNDGAITPQWGTSSGVIMSLETGTVPAFNQPVDIKIPYDDDTAIPVPYYVDEEGGLHVMQLVEADAGAGTATFQTFHASLFTWILDVLGLSPPESVYMTGYRPGDDGFQVVNNGSAYNRGGECFGMTSFSLWYWEHHLADGDFFPRFMYTVNGFRGQDIIATRTFISIGQQWNVYWPEISAETTMTDEQNYVIIRNAILNTTSPVLIYLYHTAGGGGAHSVLAWGYNRGQISMYDPNFPGVNRTAVYDTSAKSFNAYSGYDGIIYNGDGSLHLTEPYTNVLNDAENNFGGSNDATIRDIYPADESEIYERSTNITGTIDSGEVLVERLKVWVGGTSFSTDVPLEGNFSVEIPIDLGTNFIFFETEGRDVNGNYIDVPNNMDTELFTLEGVFDQAVILVTLTWDQNDTDVDLYVTDPTGDCSWYQHMVTADGGVLDVDNTWGYGPEHWTLTYSDTVRWGESYDVDLHYYSDHGNDIGTNYSVSILLYEDTIYETQYNYGGYLGADNPDNYAPGSTGPDWVHIATITPVEH